MSVLQHRRSTRERTRVPSVSEIREMVRTGTAAVFDWGTPLTPMTMAEIAAQPPAEWEYRSDETRHRGPAEATVEENLTAIREALAGPAAHTARMLMMPHAARIAELLAPYTAGPVSEWDHRPVGVAIGRELGTEAATR